MVKIPITGRLRRKILKHRREVIYRDKAKFRNGKVPCFVCGEHVEEHEATLEHKLPLSRGGTDDWGNLAISHAACNHDRGNRIKPRIPLAKNRRNPHRSKR